MIKIDEKVIEHIAVDFDGTLCADKFPEIGEPDEYLIKSLKYLQAEYGVKLILWTNREGKHLQKAVEACKEWGLTFDTVNANLPERIERYGNDCRKVGADIYIDDKAMIPYDFLFSKWEGHEAKPMSNYASYDDLELPEGAMEGEPFNDI